jgi:hypothetical protein
VHLFVASTRRPCAPAPPSLGEPPVHVCASATYQCGIGAVHGMEMHASQQAGWGHSRKLAVFWYAGGSTRGVRSTSTSTSVRSQRTAVFWHDPQSASIGTQFRGLCSLSFAQTIVFVSFRFSFYRNGRLTKFFLHPLDMI